MRRAGSPEPPFRLPARNLSISPRAAEEISDDRPSTSRQLAATNIADVEARIAMRRALHRENAGYSKNRPVGISETRCERNLFSPTELITGGNFYRGRGYFR
jgi:hypothetical protein